MDDPNDRRGVEAALGDTTGSPTSATSRHRVGTTEAVSPGEVIRVEVDGHAICLAHVKGGGFYALDDRCTHEDIELSDGDLDGFEVECPAHGSRFDVRTGAVTGLPANVATKTYRVGTEGDELYIEL